MTTRTYGTRWLAVGDAGAKETLAYMAQLCHQASADPNFVWWARTIVNDCPPRTDSCCAQAIRDFVQRAVWFQRDPLGVENITPPLEHMRRLAAQPGTHVRGDCDDAATLSAALGLAVGMPAKFVVLGFAPDSHPLGAVPGSTFALPGYNAANAPYEHVFTMLHCDDDDGWREMDTTRPNADLPARVVRALTWQV